MVRNWIKPGSGQRPVADAKTPLLFRLQGVLNKYGDVHVMINV